jgi:preprotein translocase subunit SecB
VSGSDESVNNLRFAMNVAATPSPEAMKLNPATYNAFVDDLELASVELVKIHGERTAAGVATQTRFDLEASYMRGEAVIHYRYEVTAHFVDEHETVLGDATASVQITIRTGVAIDEACIEQFGGTSGALMAHPYLREAIASTAQRIGFQGVLLPALKHQLAEPE